MNFPEQCGPPATLIVRAGRVVADLSKLTAVAEPAVAFVVTMMIQGSIPKPGTLKAAI